MQRRQNLWPQLVCTGSRNPRRQIGHLYLLSNGGSKNSSYPSDLGLTPCDDEPCSAEVSVLLEADMELVWETNRKIAGQSVLPSTFGGHFVIVTDLLHVNAWEHYLRNAVKGLVIGRRWHMVGLLKNDICRGNPNISFLHIYWFF